MLLLYSLPYLSPGYRQEAKPRLTPYILPLTQVALSGSLYTVLMVAAERFLNVHKPFSHRNTVRYGRGREDFTLGPFSRPLLGV